MNSVLASFSVVSLWVLFFFLALSGATLTAKPKDDPPPVSPSVGRDIQVQLVRGGSAELVLEGIAMPGEVVQFEVLKPPQHGSLGEPTRIDKNKVAFPYVHDGSKGSIIDRVDFRLKTGPANAWGRVKAKISISEPSSRLVLEPEILDFGPVPIGGSKSLRLRARNAGGGVVAGTLEIPPMWSIAGEPSFHLAEGASREFFVTFSPAAEESQQGRIVFNSGPKPWPSVLLKGEGEYRFSIPSQAVVSREGDNASGILPVENKSEEPLVLRIEAPSPLITPAQVEVAPGATVPIPLGLEKKTYSDSRVRLTLSDGIAPREVRITLPPPPALLEWEQGPVLDIGRIPFRNVPELEIGLRNAGANTASVTLAAGVGGLVLAPSQPRAFELAPGATALVRAVWKLPEAPGTAEASLSATEAGLTHTLNLIASIDPTPAALAASPMVAENGSAAHGPSPSPSPNVLSKSETRELKRRLPADVTVRLVPEGGAATAIITWKYRGPKPAEFHLESRMAVREVVGAESVFEKRLSVPEQLPESPVVPKWVAVKKASIQQLDKETWQGRVPGLPSGYHPLRIAVRSPPGGKRIDFVEFPVHVGDMPRPPWVSWAWSSLGVFSLLYLLRRKILKKHAE